jgi:hypothetical protein
MCIKKVTFQIKGNISEKKYALRDFFGEFPENAA